MKNAHIDSCCASLDGTAATVDLASKPGTRWRAALAGLVAAPMRLHRYRHFHAEVIEDAIRAYDCHRPCGEGS